LNTACGPTAVGDDAKLRGVPEADGAAAPEAFVTIQKTVILSLNQAAFQALGQPAVVEFLCE
jgi:hypothetical protein